MIAIIGAMDEEVAEVFKLMDTKETQTISGIDFVLGTLNHKDVCVFQSGVGLTNAAMRTTIAFENFDIEGLVNIGTAGGLGDHVEILDVIISTKVAYHEFDITVFGNPRDFSDDNRFCYKANQEYINIAKECIEDRVLVGPMVSGNQFISKLEQIENIEKYYPETLCADMEAASIAHVCDFYQKPFIILRSISDHVKHHENNLSFEEYLQEASKRSAEFVYKFLAKL